MAQARIGAAAAQLLLAHQVVAGVSERRVEPGWLASVNHRLGPASRPVEWEGIIHGFSSQLVSKSGIISTEKLFITQTSGNQEMGAKEIFEEGKHSFLCHTVEAAPGVFSCAITFRGDFGHGTATTNLKLKGVFHNADIAMGAGENYGRALIRKHGDMVQYLAFNGLVEE